MICLHVGLRDGHRNYFENFRNEAANFLSPATKRSCGSAKFSRGVLKNALKLLMQEKLTIPTKMLAQESVSKGFLINSLIQTTTFFLARKSNLI